MSGSSSSIETPLRPSLESSSSGKTLLPPTPSTFNLPARPRYNSPLSSTHIRSHSASNALSAPPLTRAHSSPGLGSRNRSSFPSSHSPIRPSSPSGLSSSSSHRHSPLRRAEEDRMSYPNFGGANVETISEHAELDTSSVSRPSSLLSDFDGSHLLSSDNHHLSQMPSYGSFPRPTRRRPSSPLHQQVTPNMINEGSYGMSSSPILGATTTPPATTPPATTPPTRYNESFPGLGYAYSSTSSSLSMPSTPSSLRSRSPSISSLETIPDTPDAEAAAIEAERIAREQREREKEDAAVESDESEGSTRRSFSGVRTLGLAKDKRKRWSVCGAERRGDLDLETIWED